MPEIIEMAKLQGGYITASQVREAGISTSRLSEMIQQGQLDRVSRGVYHLASELTDEFLSAQLRFPKGIFSDECALWLHNYSDRAPEYLTMTFARSYRATPARNEQIQVRTCADNLISLGLVEIPTPYGNKVKAYDIERTLCDIVRGHAVSDVQIVVPAYRTWVNSPGSSVNKILKYAEELGVLKKVRAYLEVLL